MPTFCRHNRFLERCPICSKPPSGASPKARAAPRTGGAAPRSASGAGASRRGRRRGESVTVHRELRAEDDGYRSELVPGLRASADAGHLAREIAFSSGRLLALSVQPPDLYGEIRALAAVDLELATWTCFLLAYLCPLEGDDPFAGIRLALTRAPDGLFDASRPPDLGDIPLGPRSSHDARHGAETLIAYRQWVARNGRPDGAAGAAGAAVAAGVADATGDGSQAVAFTGDPAWSPQRRFERLFERLALPGLARMGRYELLVTLGRLGLYELLAGSLHLAGVRGLSADDPTTLAAKRVFGIGDPLLLERRAASLAQAIPVPVDVLDLALANWLSPRRATVGFPPDTSDDGAFERAIVALGL
jgi:hypothetical protein